MKIKDKYKLLNYAKKQYSEIFNCNYEFKNLSKKALYKLLKENKHSSICEWSYCCYGLYENCWQDPYAEGIWDMSQEQVNKIIKGIIDETAKICRRHSRILYCENKDTIDIIIVARDVMSTDYLITFTNEEWSDFY